MRLRCAWSSGTTAVHVGILKPLDWYITKEMLVGTAVAELTRACFGREEVWERGLRKKAEEGRGQEALFAGQVTGQEWRVLLQVPTREDWPLAVGCGLWGHW